ncbi:Toluene efflux pump membrane transporter TtgE [Maioricimonas rarisocia]|uniref:Toluene efflux pump membrane transporter TtgE n=1 Tax=Maioricimonas rarisocia TaxID=2528026 RepID=A0A517ZD33_9PLAN|nr:efflux RND transporter permease subunit [Maioricimonas rarisocia]QDU40369.1 Toluene efflux pump membrane transporter TtgE [Maioricimonas rarisocia]
MIPSSRLNSLFYRNPRLTLLTICLILVAGLSSYSMMPRMEDPLLSERVALVNTLLPGADAIRVESLVTEKLEHELLEIPEIKEIRSQSRAGVSLILVELRDDADDVHEVWSRFRSKLDDATTLLPREASEPRFDTLDIRANALLVALKWTGDASGDAAERPSEEKLAETNFAVLCRLADELEDSIDALRGTEDVELYGRPEEEILVEIDEPRLAAMGLTVSDVAQQLRQSDAKVSAGYLRGSSSDLLLEVGSELDTLDRIAATPIRFGTGGESVTLGEIASVHRGISDPPRRLSLVDGVPAIVLGALVRPGDRLDHWTEAATKELERFRSTLPRGVELVTIFDQNHYVETRLGDLIGNLLMGCLAVVGVIWFTMGWRSGLIVGTALPLSALMVIAGMRLLDIPIHQMSVTGLILALGLLIDNAIVIVDEVNTRCRSGMRPAKAVSESVSYLAVPLFGSTLTTAFAFAPLALMEGPAGEFVGSIAISVTLAIFSSLFLAMTVVPAIAARAAQSAKSARGTGPMHWWHFGFSSRRLNEGYLKTLRYVFERPRIGIVIGLILPVTGFALASQLPEQFFPPSDRDQFHVEVHLPAHASLKETLTTVDGIRQHMLAHEHVSSVNWFVGESAPSFYYNLITDERDVPNYAQGLVQLDCDESVCCLIHEIQDELDVAFPHARILVRQLEQGPPFNAPIEIRLFGPDLDVLDQLGNDVRQILSEVPQVVHTQAALGDSMPTLRVRVDEEEVRRSGLTHTAIATQLNDTLEGAIGGSVLESTEELPVRVRVANTRRNDLTSIRSLNLRGSEAGSVEGFAGRSLDSLGGFDLIADIPNVPHFGGMRLNEVQAYLQAGVLPGRALADFRRRLEASGFELPAGYSMQYGGETAKRNEAVSNLLSNTSVLVVLMLATLVLSFNSFRLAGIVAFVGALSVGLGLAALWVFGYPFGFMAIIGTMGLIGVAINDSIVVLAAIRQHPLAREGHPVAICNVVQHATRHIVSTTLTTIVGFMPLMLAGGAFWPPLAVAIAGGVGGATLLALFFCPSMYLLLLCKVPCELREPAAASHVSSYSHGGDPLPEDFAPHVRGEPLTPSHQALPADA